MAVEIKHPDGHRRVQKTLTIRRPPGELYDFWHHFDRLPRFMEHVKDVEVVDERRSHWVVQAPAGRTVEWDAEVVEDVPNERIAWRSVGNADVANEGEVRFRPAPADRGTEVSVTLVYDPPGGAAGAAMAKLLGEEPTTQLDEDLYRFKQLMETGRIPHVEGQPTGDR